MEKVFVFVQTFLAGLQDQLREGMQDPDRDRGAALVEYGLLVGLIAVVCIAIIATLGGQIAQFFQDIVTALT